MKENGNTVLDLLFLNKNLYWHLFFCLMQNCKRIGLAIQCFLCFTLKSKQQYVSSVQNDEREITEYRNLRSTLSLFMTYSMQCVE